MPISLTPREMWDMEPAERLEQCLSSLYEVLAIIELLGHAECDCGCATQHQGVAALSRVLAEMLGNILEGLNMGPEGYSPTPKKE